MLRYRYLLGWVVLFRPVFRFKLTRYLNLIWSRDSIRQWNAGTQQRHEYICTYLYTIFTTGRQPSGFERYSSSC